MKIVGIAACTAGIAHTYMAREKLMRAAEKLGHTARIETQGTIGIENELTAQEIAEADVVILAVDVKVSGEGRFKGKTVVRVGTAAAIKNPLELLRKIEKAIDANQ